MAANTKSGHRAGVPPRLFNARPTLHNAMDSWRHDHHPAAVDRVGHRPAEQRADERRAELGKTHETDVERRAGEQVHLVEDRDEGEL